MLHYRLFLEETLIKLFETFYDVHKIQSINILTSGVTAHQFSESENELVILKINFHKDLRFRWSKLEEQPLNLKSSECC